MRLNDLPISNKTKADSDSSSALNSNSNQKVELMPVTKGIAGFTAHCLSQKESSVTGVKSSKEEYSKQCKEVSIKLKDQKYLEIKVIQKMLKRFLLKKKMNKEELTQKLGITVEELEQLLSFDEIYVVATLIAKVNLPLIKLYCETKWPR